MDAEEFRVSVCHDDTNVFSWLKVHNLAESLDAVEEFSLGKNVRNCLDILDFVAVAQTSDDTAKSIRIAAVKLVWNKQRETTSHAVPQLLLLQLVLAVVVGHVILAVHGPVQSVLLPGHRSA